MARDFDGVNDKIDFGSDASIDDFGATGLTYAIWMDVDSVTGAIGLKSIDFQEQGMFFRPATLDVLFRHLWSTTAGRWNSTTTTITTGLNHIVLSYDGSSTTNDPSIWINGVAEGINEINTPAGTITADAAEPLVIGEASDGSNDYNGRSAYFCYDNEAWDAAMANRHRWWGVAPGGPSTVAVWQPLWSSDLNNKGTATANGTATGTTTASLPKVERFWGSLMGCGR